jgi:hypothetical protein
MAFGPEPRAGARTLRARCRAESLRPGMGPESQVWVSEANPPLFSPARPGFGRRSVSPNRFKCCLPAAGSSLTAAEYSHLSH